MFVGFNLKTTETYSEYYDKGKEIFEQQKKVVEEDLKKFVGPDGIIDGTKIAENWFPQLEADIFISHSHVDEKQAVGLAGWLWSEFRLNSFIDSGVWGYANNLLQMIDEKYCRNMGDKTYNYNDRNYSTAHVHMMLNAALCRMIDKVECVFLLNTPNSITCSAPISNTKSSWIYSEIVMTEIVRKKALSEYRKESPIILEAYKMNQKLQVKYDISLEHFKPLDNQELRKWENKQGFRKDDSKNNVYPLDKLYELKGILT